MKWILLFLLLTCNKPSGTAKVQTLLNTASVSNLRVNDAVIITTTVLESLKPSELVAFKFDSVWKQIPVQVDEKVDIDISKPYNGAYNPTGYFISAYADANTYTGADTNTSIDTDDEIVIMAKDAGNIADSTYPSGVIMGSKKQVTINDPLGGISYIYLFKNNGILQQNAGINYVSYTYPVNTYFSSFTIPNGRNIENTFVTTSKYKLNFIGEWILSGMYLNGTDILDRQKVFFGDGVCLRSEDTFSDAENCFVTNKVGCVRAIRSVMGANSGQYTQRTYFFYEGRNDIITDLRVHEIKGIHDVLDYSTAAIGMKYTNNINTNPISIDGVKELISKGDIKWELTSGSLGSIVNIHRRQTTFIGNENIYSSYWDDTKTKPASACTGDGMAIGSSGIATGFNDQTKYTEPFKGSYNFNSPNFRVLKTTRVIYYEVPNTTNSVAQAYNNQYDTPLSITIN